jgi:hypothetical protein
MLNWKLCERTRSWTNLRYCPGICLEGLRKITKNINQDNRSLGRDLNPGPPEYKSRSSVVLYIKYTSNNGQYPTQCSYSELTIVTDL